MTNKLVFLTLLIIPLVVGLLTGNWWAWGVFVYGLGRVIYLRDKNILKVCLCGLVIIGGLTAVHIHQQQSLLSPKETHFIIDVPVTQIVVSGDQLKLKGEMQLYDGKTEKVVVFYRLKNQTEQQYWQSQKTSLRCEVTGELTQPSQNQNKGLFNYRQYLKQQQIYWLLNCDSLAPIQTLTEGKYAFIQMKKYISDAFADLADTSVRKYVYALFFNQKDFLDKEVIQLYQEMGLIHLFSLSGFHVHFFVKQLKRLLLRWGMLKEHFDHVVLLFLTLYTLLLGVPYGLFRATFVYFYNWMRKRLGYDASSLQGTCLSALLILCCQPYAVLYLGFQLSYLLAAVLLFIAPVLQNMTYSALKRALYLNFMCLLATLPLVLTKYYQFSWIGLIWNGVYAYLFAQVLFPSLLGVMGGHLLFGPQAFTGIQALLGKVFVYLEQVSEWINDWPGCRWIVGTLPSIMVFCLILIILYFYICIGEKQKIKRALLFLSIQLGCLWAWPYLNPMGTVQMVNVGQGDCLIIVMPHHEKVYLIDVAEKPQFKREQWAIREHNSVVSRQVLPSLKRLGVRKLDGVFLTHADFDHMGGFNELSQYYPIARLYLPIGMQGNTDKVQQLKSTLAATKQQTKLEWLQSGDRLSHTSGLLFQVLAPNEMGQGENADSLVMYSEIGPCHFLFTGDSEGKADLQTQKMIQAQQLKIDILKVAHHGSDHSTTATYLKQIKPRMAWISVGENNRYGHPSPRVLTDLEPYGSVFRTDLDGGVYYHFTKKSAKIETTAQEWENEKQ